jgi:hypothetical protein
MVIAIGAIIHSANAATVIDPDAYSAGTLLNNAFPGVTLSAHGSTSSADVLSYTSPFASTGSRVFAMYDGDYLWGDGDFDWLKAEFAGGASQVSLDFISNDGDENATLNAYDAAGNLVDQAVSIGLFDPYQVVTLTVSAPYIAYITAEGDPVNLLDNWVLDNLEYTPVPEPMMFSILGLGGSILLYRRKNR